MYGFKEENYTSDKIAYIMKGFEMAVKGFTVLEVSKYVVVFRNNETGEEVEYVDPSREYEMK